MRALPGRYLTRPYVVWFILLAGWVLGGRAAAAPAGGPGEIIFAARQVNTTDGHWYANFAYYTPDPSRKGYRAGGRLCRLNTATGKVTVLLDDPAGAIRDPQVHYDARKILFSWRKAGTEYFNLYEIGVDGTSLRLESTRRTLTQGNPGPPSQISVKINQLPENLR